MSPNRWTATPEVPGWLEMTKGATSCQHSSNDSPLAAAMAVRARDCCGSGSESGVQPVMKAKVGRMDKRMAMYMLGRERDCATNIHHTKREKRKEERCSTQLKATVMLCKSKSHLRHQFLKSQLTPPRDIIILLWKVMHPTPGRSPKFPAEV